MTPNNPRLNKTTTLTDFLRYQTRDLTSWIGKVGVALRIHPDAVTVLGLVFVIGAALLIADGQFFLAGITLILGLPLDALDGAIARAMGRKSRFGAFLDSTLDRYADAFLYMGLAYYYAAQGLPTLMALSVFALIGAYGVSYARARAEGLNIGSIKDGLFDRMVRSVVIILMLLTGMILPGLIVLAVGNHITAIHRIILVYHATKDDERR
ncbi:MAG: CDP-alcohol phosphatidyltransferase family protein [Anaerolineae bacterium]|nr:CDP-alcohol phosphatidyltransferase family protein [Anaerolineae bacterium]